MNITIFKDVTTEDALLVIEKEAKSYTGLYVDMDNAPERKYVKDHAADISGLIKKLERARIDIKKGYGAKVEIEYAEIVDRLKSANQPFTLLLDGYKEKRAIILSEKKAIEDAKLLMIQVEGDHEMALLINKTFEFDKAESSRLASEESERLRVDAEAKADQRQKDINAAQEIDRVNAENARLANVEHVRSINNEILMEMLDLGLDRAASMAFIKLVANKKLKSLTINY